MMESLADQTADEATKETLRQAAKDYWKEG